MTRTTKEQFIDFAGDEPEEQLSKAAINWLAKGPRGISSNTMFSHLTGVDALNGWKEGKGQDHPYDPDDLDRCLKLLEAVPELRKELPRMAKVSKEWKALIDNWADIEACHLSEVGLGWTKAKKAPKTYAMMRRVLDSARKP